MSSTVSELSEAWKDHVEWRRHVRDQRRVKDDPDIFQKLETAKVGAKSLLSDFSEEPESSVVTIFETPKGRFKIDAISNHGEFELHRDEYDPEQVIGLVFFQNGEPFFKRMKS